MTLQDLALLSRRGRIGVAMVVAVLVVAVVGAAALFLDPAPPRHIVLASGLEDGQLHEFAQRYIKILARAGVTVEERMTKGPGQNLQLLEDPRSGVDVAFVQGGIAKFPQANDVVMLASLYYVPMWIFYRDTLTLSHIGDLRGHRVSIGEEGSGARSFADAVFKLNRLSSDNMELLSLSNSAALIALKSGEIDAAIIVDESKSMSVVNALSEPNLRLFNFNRADAYSRLLPYVTTLTLPEGVIDLARDIPDKQIALIATKEMLAARDSLHPALIGLLIDAAREIHSDQSVFRKSGEFPQTTPVDLRVSHHAERHNRFGASFLYQYLPFWMATLAERAIIILVPLAAVLFPLFHFLPQLLRWHERSRIYRWYGELALLERDVATRSGALPEAEWLADLDRIERSVSRLRTPVGFASEAYTLRQHIDFVRQTVMARTNLPSVASGPG